MPLFTSELSYSDDYPTIEPSLKLDFANARALDPRITFTRASTATYVGANGLIKTAGEDEARFDHDPATGESLGLLIEETRTNLVTYSNHFGLGSSWNTIRATVTINQTVAPDGTLTADLLIPNSFSSSDGYTRFYYTVSNSTNYCYSIFVKQKDSYFDYVYFNAAYGSQSGTSARAWFRIDPENGAVGTVDGGATATIEEYPNGWYKCTINTTSDTTGSVPFVVVPVTADNTTSFNGDGNAGVYIWGAQLEEGAFPTSYIPTAGATATRADDVCTITGENFSSWYNQSEGTVLSTFKSPVPEANTRYWLLITDGANSTSDGYRFEMNRILTSTSSGSNAWSSVGDWLTTGYTQNAENRTAFGYDRINNSNSFSNNGVIQETNTSATDVTVAPTTITIGAAAAFNNFSGHISRLTYWPRRLTDEQLQELTQ